MTAITAALNLALLHFVWQGVTIAFLLWIALFLLRRRTAHARYLASCLALALMAVLPAITAWILYTPPSAALSSGAAGFTIAYATLTAAPLPRSFPIGWMAAVEAWALPVWSAGVLLFSIRLVWGCRQISRMRRRGAAPDEALITIVSAIARRLGVTRAVRVLIARDGESPSVVGWIRPVVLIPAGALIGLTSGQLEAVLAHELAHIRRHDYLVNLLQILVETLLFYHPAVWWVSARIRHERELCCDDLAVESCGDAVCYARALTKLERLRITAPAMAMGSNSGSMLYRVQRILGGAAQEYVPSKLPGILALALGLVCFGLNIHWARGQQQPQVRVKAEQGIAVRAETEPDDPGVTVNTGGAALASRQRIEYPGFAQERGIQGTVTAELTLNGEGVVTDARVVSGPAELRKYVLQSVLDWRFAPPYANTMLQISVQFDRAAAAAAPPRTKTFRGYAVTVNGQNPEAAAALAQVNEQIAKYKQAYQDKLLEKQNAESQAGTEQAKAQLADAERRYVELNERRNAELQRSLQEQPQQNREHQIQEARTQLERAEQTQNASAVEEARARLAAAENAAGGEWRVQSLEIRSGGRLAGRRLEGIHMVGIDADAVPPLGIRIGDSLTEQSMADVTAAIKQSNPQLEVRFLPTERGGAELRIALPQVQK